MDGKARGMSDHFPLTDVLEKFPALAIPGVASVFVRRVPGVCVSYGQGGSPGPAAALA